MQPSDWLNLRSSDWMNLNRMYSLIGLLMCIHLLSIPQPSVSASVGSMDMTGIPHGSCPTSLLSSQVGGATTTAVDAPLLKFGLELNPLDRPEMDVVVRAELRPIKITYDAVS